MRIRIGLALLAVTLFGTKVPLAPSTVRKEGNVVLTLTERRGDTSVVARWLGVGEGAVTPMSGIDREG